MYLVWYTQHAAIDMQEHKEVIAEAMEVAEYNSGQAVYCQGDTGSRFYVIKEGSVTCSKAADPARTPAVSVLNAGQYFGERALLKDEIRCVCIFCSAQQCHRTENPLKPPSPSIPFTVYVSVCTYLFMCTCAELAACLCVLGHRMLCSLCVIIVNDVQN